MQTIDAKRFEEYYGVTEIALEKAKSASESLSLKNARKEFIDTVERYLFDARHFFEKGDYVNAFAAVNYAHGWLDAGARIGLWVVKDSKLFAVDEE